MEALQLCDGVLSCPGAYYLFDIGTLRERVRYLQTRLPKDVSLCYAVKANPFLGGAIESLLPRFEVCSPGEAEICDRLGIPKDKTVISGVYKTPAVMEKMVREDMQDGKGRIYTVESMTQYALLRGLAEKYQKKLPLLLRLTNDSQFGITEEQIREIVREASPSLYLRGIQFFSGTQKTSLKKIKRELGKLDALILSLREECGFTAEELEYGPGFPVFYFEGEEFEEESFLRAFSELLGELKCGARITLELGRSIAASCGRYYTHVVDQKRNGGQNYLLVDGGMHQLVYFGQQMAMKQPKVTVCGREKANAEDFFHICGSLCSMNDILVKQMPLPKVKIGDVLCFHNTGAYCMTEGMALFLSRELPAVYFRQEDGSIVCVREPVETAAWNMPGNIR